MRVATLALMHLRLRSRSLPAMAMTLPLIGVFLALTFFLLPLFASSGEVCGCSSRRELARPTATQIADLEAGPIVTVRREAVLLNGFPEDDIRLFGDLVTLRNNWVLLHPGERVERRFLLDADRALPFGLIARVVRVAEHAGYDSPDYVVDVLK